jgi:hypothetical protein
MTIYSVHNREGAPFDQAVLVPEAFSWNAFVFTVFWALWHRLWVIAAVLLALAAVINLGARLLGIGDVMTGLATLAVNFVFGFEAQGLRARALAHAGYRLIGMSHGRNEDDAAFRYLEEHPIAAPLAVRPDTARFPGQRVAPDTLGIFGNA